MAAKWREEGHEPDYRFSLANERTFLAWLRTALALLAGGVVLDQFIDSPFVKVLAIGLTVVAGAVCVLAYLRWRANEIAMRHDRPLPHSSLMPVLGSVLLIGVAALVVVLVVLG